MTDKTGSHFQRRFDVVLFDLGSTLIYFEGDWNEVMARSAQALAHSLKEGGLDIDEGPFIKAFNDRIRAYHIERDKEFIEYTTEYVLRILLEDMGKEDLSSLRLRPSLDAMYRVTEEHWNLDEETIPMLETLGEQGYQISLISNAADAHNVNRLLDKMNLRPYFGLILVSASVGIRKPHPRIFLMALDRWKVRPHQVVMVGDTLSADILGARRVDIAGVWINRWAGAPSSRVYEDAIEPDATIGSLCELPELLLNWQDI